MQLDRSAWKDSDKEWLKSRKEEWKQIQKNLKPMKGWLRGSYLKHHKALYFEGIIDDDVYKYIGGKEFGHALPLFIMWYHPDRSLERYQKIFNEWLAINYGALNKSRSLLFELPSEEFTSEYGMLGGREKDIVAALNPSFDPSESTDKNRSGESYRFCLSPGLIAKYCFNGIKPLVLGKERNPYSPGVYLWFHLCENIHNLTDEVRRDRWKICLQKILSYDFESNDPGSIGYQLARKLLDQYESRDLPEPMLAFWDEAKAELG